MANNRVIAAGAILYECDSDVVHTLDIIAKGTVRASKGDVVSFDLPAGSIIGIGESPDRLYTMTYEATDEVTIFSYPYINEADLVALFKANPKLLSMLVSSCARFAYNFQRAALEAMEYARSEQARIREAYEAYPKLSIAAGVKPSSFPEVEKIEPPMMLDPARGWHRDFIDDLYSHSEKLKKEIFTIPSIGLGLGLTINTYALETREFLTLIFDYLDDIRETSAEFQKELDALRKKKDPDTASTEAAGEGVAEEELDASVTDCLAALEAFARPNPESFLRFKESLTLFKRQADPYGGDDVARKIRRDLTDVFYEIYVYTFLRSYDVRWEMIPLGVRMFLLFGYVEQDLAGEENTRKLAAIAETYRIGASRYAISGYEWLRLVYSGQEMPSKNEFDLDYPAYLADCKRNGDIREADVKRLMNSLIDRLKFEVKNLFATANRITFGRITTFVPVFDKENVIKPLEQAFLSAKRVEGELQRIRSIDFRAFYRQSVVSLPEVGLNSFYLDEEILPYIILMPNIGSRASLWQEIDSHKRTTPARMVISIFHTENVEDSFTKLFAEFRWEMCKTEQGVHWNDITDPSLTSMYCDYLQFYRKNSSMSAETKEKLSIALKNNSNNFKKIFLADYLTYIKYEANGALRLNKHAREILFKFCPFTKELREKLKDNPQFAEYIKQHDFHCAAKLKPMQNLQMKLQKAGMSLPDPIYLQMKFYEK